MCCAQQARQQQHVRRVESLARGRVVALPCVFVGAFRQQQHIAFSIGAGVRKRFVGQWPLERRFETRKGGYMYLNVIGNSLAECFKHGGSPRNW